MYKIGDRRIGCSQRPASLLNSDLLLFFTYELHLTTFIFEENREILTIQKPHKCPIYVVFELNCTGLLTRFLNRPFAVLLYVSDLRGY